MRSLAILFLASTLHFAALAEEKASPRLGPGDHARTFESGNRKRHFLVHVPPGYDPARPAPVVLALHGAAMTGTMMAGFSGLNATSDREGFIVVYPSGTGTGPFLTWNAGGFSGRWAENRPDDVAFIAAMLDELAKLVAIDEKRIYACGMSNGGMMCYRLAAELSDRIAAIAPVAGTIAIERSRPNRPVPVLHIHGLKDKIVPWDGPGGKAPGFMTFRSVEDSVNTWVKINGCDQKPVTETISKPSDEMKVIRKSYRGGKNDSSVILIVVEEGGHTWPGQPAPVRFVGKSAANISANDLIWDFFGQHRLK